jgi:hypothetical protein
MGSVTEFEGAKVIYRLTETLDGAPPSSDSFLSNATYTRIFPGLVDGDYIKLFLGDRIFNRAIELGVLIPQE